MEYILYYKNDKQLKFTNQDDVMEDLYFLKATVPTIEQINAYVKSGTNNKIIKLITAKGDPNKLINSIKKRISRIENKIPLYDEYTKNIYLISNTNVYDRVIYNHYRFPNTELYDVLLKRKKKLEKTIKDIIASETDKSLTSSTSTSTSLSKSSTNGNSDPDTTIRQDIAQKNVKKKSEFFKLNLMIQFLQSFKLDILETTYIKVFYFYANAVGKDITICKRPSFIRWFKHTRPFYSRRELINLALNMELIKSSNKYYDNEGLNKLCEMIRSNDISRKVIIKHQEYIIKDNRIGIIQYYSFQGSYFLNRYLRGNIVTYNKVYEDIINSMTKLINGAPAFNKSYILYRFVHSDDHIQFLNVGDQYIEPSFISTTRDPFYQPETYKFGFILIKIHIPANVKGVGLCIESYSHFQDEQEIIFGPGSILRLDKKDNNVPYYHIDSKYSTKIETRYEFTYMGRGPLYIEKKDKIKHIEMVDFLAISDIDVMTVGERIKYFMKTYVNTNFQFVVSVGDNKYTMLAEYYDSMNAYRKLYACKTNNGFSMYTIVDNYILFFIEIGETNGIETIYVNYYFKYASNNKTKNIDDSDFLKFISSIAYWFKIRNVVIYAEYLSCDECYDENKLKLYYGGNYCVDFYKYLKNKYRRFSNIKAPIDSTIVKPMFDYYDLDILFETDPVTILIEKDEIYQIYDKSYKILADKARWNLADFYIWIVENQCVYLNDLLGKMYRLYGFVNPFERDLYLCDPYMFLYGIGLLDAIPESIDIDELFNKNITEILPNKNVYRTTELSRARGYSIMPIKVYKSSMDMFKAHKPREKEKTRRTSRFQS